MSDEPNQATPLARGARLGPYEIAGTLGEGGMGAVYRAMDTRLDRPVALKVISRFRGQDQERKRFHREAKLASALNHPNIVSIYEYGSDRGVDFIAMELVEGQPLHRLLARGKLPVGQALSYARQMALALSKAHAQGVIHRDLKPGNVIVSPDGAVKLLDFGLAKRHAAEATSEEDVTQSMGLTQAGAVMGTPAYMSPEQAMGEEATHRSDLFSYGAILYEMASGQRAFPGSSSTVLAKVVGKEPPAVEQLNPRLPPAFAQLIRECMSKSPEARPKSAGEVLARLDAIGQPARRRARAWVAAAVAAAAIAILPSIPAVRARLAGFGGSGSALTSQAWTERGQQYIDRYDQRGNTDRAVEAFQKAIELDAGNAQAYAGLAQAFGRKASESPDAQWITRARAAAEKAVAVDGLLANAHASLGQALVQDGKLDEAQKALDRAIELEPRNKRALRAMAGVAMRRREMDRAEKLYRDAIAADPKDWRSQTELGVLLYRLGRNDEAVRLLEELNRQTSSNSVVLNNLSVAYQAAGRFEDAASAVQRSMELSPTQRGYSNLGTLLFYLGRHDSAAEAFEKALGIDANSYQTWGNLGDAYRWAPGKRGKAEEAYRHAAQLLDEALAKNQSDAAMLALAATYAAKRGKSDDAKGYLGRVDLNPAKAAAAVLYKAAVVEELAGNREQALRHLEAALKRGYAVKELAADPEMLNVRKDARYHLLVGSAH
jgi:serine/threonine-protein kinase